MAEPNTVTKRLHIGGITPDITPIHLRDRFKIFGQVDQVEELQPDAVGQVRPFAYLTIQITPPQLKRCMNILSGSMYRGAQLRIAEAKPRYAVKIQKEKNPTPIEKEKERVKRRKRVRREFGPEVGKEAQDMRVITEENYERTKFWTLNSTQHLIRPLAIRPTHSLSQPTVTAAPTDSEKVTTTSKPIKRNPPSRQWRRVINPALWNSSHLTEDAFASDDQDVGRTDIGEWVFEEVGGDRDVEDQDAMDQQEDGDGSKVILGRWRKVGGEDEGNEEVVRVNRRRLSVISEDGADNVDSDMGLDWDTAVGQRQASPLFVDRTGIATGSPLFGGREDVGDNATAVDGSEWDSNSGQSVSPLLASRSGDITAMMAKGGAVEEEELADMEDVDEDVKPTTSPPMPNDLIVADAGLGVMSGSSSPLFATRDISPPASTQIKAHLTSQSLPTAASLASASSSRPRPIIPAEILTQAKTEVSLSLSVLSSLLAESPDAQCVPATPGRDEWKGFAGSDSEDEDTLFGDRNVVSDGVLRIRGGAPDGVEEDVDMDDEDLGSDSGSESSSSDSSDSGSSTSFISSSSSSSSAPSSSSSSSSSSLGSTSGTGTTASPKTDTPPTGPSLRSLFNLTSTSGSTSFTLPSSAPATGFSLSALTGDLDLDLDEELDIPLAPHLSTSSKLELSLLSQMTSKQVSDPSPDIPLFFAPADPSRVEMTRAGRARHPMVVEKEAEGYEGFWRQETDESMRERWDRVRGELTQEWKRRGREARKQRKRRGGGEDA